MKRCIVACAWLAIWILVGVPGSAQDKKKEITDFIEKPGPEHKILESLVGNFDAAITMYLGPKEETQKSKGTMKRTMILGGRFLREDFEGKIGPETFTGIGTAGFDTNKKRYVSTWIDSMSTGIMITHGIHDKEKKTITYLGEIMEGDKKTQTKDILRMVSDDEQLFEMYKQPEGEKEYSKIMEISFTRIKAK